ncbi:nucleotide-binding protein [Klebsiella pneumoniae subsp. pneumoniae]|nr:nucleotide-binding protein [Klebsiella pneumoniae subsp. pneumoniae]
MAKDLFSEINNAVLDLQSSQLQTYERPLIKLAQLLRHPDLEPYNAELTEGLDVEAFIAESEKTGGSMVGSAQLAWPDDPKQALGLTLLLIEKLAADPGYATNFGHHFFYSGKKVIAGIHALTGQLIIPFVRDYKSYIQAKGSTDAMLKAQFSRKVFIVHGHDDGARETVARFLERIGLEAIILHEQANQGRTIIEKVVAHSDVGFAVVLLTPDDEGCVKGGTPEPRARQNVLLELGYFIGRLGRDKVCALKRGAVEIPSDFAGVVWETMDSGGGWKPMSSTLEIIHKYHIISAQISAWEKPF